MNYSSQQLKEWAELDCDAISFDELESKLESELAEQMADLDGLKIEREKIGNPDSIGDTVMNVVWEQINNQLGVNSGKEFIRENKNKTLDLRKDAHIITIDNYGKEGVGSHNAIIKSEQFIEENHGMPLDLSNDAHIQTTKNFENGIIAKHNYKIDFKQRYNDWQSNFQHDQNGNVITHQTRTGKPEATLVDGARNPFDKGRPVGSVKSGKDADHDISAGEIIRDPAANAHVSKEQQIAFANSEVNVHEMDSAQNRSKGDKTMTDWLDNPNSKGQKPKDIFDISDEQERQYRENDAKAREEYEKIKQEGERHSEESGKQTQKEEEERSINAGKQSRKEEAKLIGGKALKAVVMGLLAALVKEIVQKLIAWFRSGARKLETFIESIKQAIRSFVSNLWENLKFAANTFLTTIATAIYGPIIGTIKKVWIFLKQGYKSIKEAIDFLRNPANKDMPLSIKLMEVSKIVVVGLTAGGAILLGEAIEKGLISLGLVVEIPLMGSLASIIGLFMGALVSGIIGALALNVVDRFISKKLKTLNAQQQIAKGNDLFDTQSKLCEVVKEHYEATKDCTVKSIKDRHKDAADAMRNTIHHIISNSEIIDAPITENAEVVDGNEKKSANNDALNDLFDTIDRIK